MSEPDYIDPGYVEGEPYPLTDPDDPDGRGERPIVGNVRVSRRKNRDRSKTYYLVWELPSGKYERKRLFRTEPQPDRKSLSVWERQAREAAYEHQREIEGERSPGRPIRHWTLLDAFEWYSVWIRGSDQHVAQLAPGTADRHERVIRQFIGYLGEHFPTVRRMTQLSARHINGTGSDGEAVGYRYARERDGIASSTLTTELSDIRSWLTFAHQRGWLAKPLLFAMPAREAGRAVVVPDTQAVSRALDALSECPVASAFVTVLAVTGLRQGELKSAPLSAYDPMQRSLTLAKGARERNKRHARTIPIAETAAQVLDAYLSARDDDSRLLFSSRGRPLSSQANAWLRPLGLKPHDLRRWAINQLHRWSCSPVWIDYLVGHAPRSVDGKAYAAPTLADLRGWVERLATELSLSARI